MERGSSKHGPVLDEVLKKESEEPLPGSGSARAAGHREGWGTGEEVPDAVGHLDDRPPTGGLSHREAEERAELAKHIPGARFPGDKRALIEGAREMDAPDRVVAKLKALPDGRRFENVEAVWEALGGTKDING